MLLRSIIFGILLLCPVLVFGQVWLRVDRSVTINQEEAHMYRIPNQFVAQGSVLVEWSDGTPFKGKVEISYPPRIDGTVTVQLDSFVVSTDKLVDVIDYRNVARMVGEDETIETVADTTFIYKRNHRSGDVVVKYQVWEFK